MLPVPLMTLDTVLMETPECLATSLIVTLDVNRAPYQSAVTHIPNPHNSTLWNHANPEYATIFLFSVYLNKNI